MSPQPVYMEHTFHVYCKRSLNNYNKYSIKTYFMVVQQAKHSSCFSLAVVGKCRGDLVFVLDSSQSIKALQWFIVKQFVMDIIRGLNVNAKQTRVGVVVYSTWVEDVFHLQQHDDVDVMLKTVWEIGYMAGVTNTAGGIKVTVI